MQTSLSTPSKTSLYKADFYAWTQEQSYLLRAGSWEQLDRENLVEEIESLGRQQRRELRNRLAVLLGHLLKWEYQPERRSRSWLATLRVQRRDIASLLQENPSLQLYLEEALVEGYANGRDLAMGETGLAAMTFPVDCPYGVDQVLDLAFYPGEKSEFLD
ncbi:MAG: DUF29 domain-containing protein [Spirulinaceae cyanobacterium]